MIRPKYALSDTGQIEAPGRLLKCVSSKNEDLDWDLEKKELFPRIEDSKYEIKGYKSRSVCQQNVLYSNLKNVISLGKF